MMWKSVPKSSILILSGNNKRIKRQDDYENVPFPVDEFILLLQPLHPSISPYWKRWSLSFIYPPQAIELTETNDNTGRYDDANAVTWVIKPLDACQDTYIIGYRVADANATSFLYTDLSTKTLTTTYAEPGIELKEGHWLIADHDFENQKKRIKREAKLYLSISQQPLYRCFTHKNFVCQRMELVLRTFLYF